MNRIGNLVLILAAVLYLLAHGILGLSESGMSIFYRLASIILNGDLIKITTIILSVCGIAAGIFLLLAFYKVDIPITNLILSIFIVIWIIVAFVVDIIKGTFSGIGNYLWVQFSIIATDAMVLGALMISTKRFGRKSKR